MDPSALHVRIDCSDVIEELERMQRLLEEEIQRRAWCGQWCPVCRLMRWKAKFNLREIFRRKRDSKKGG